MTMILDIADVARLTGLSPRALRFYEARGLVTPLRTASARRLYDAAALERLHQVVALKRAGLSLARIKQLFDRRTIDLRALIVAQLDQVTEQAQALADIRAILATTLSRIDRGEPIDAATFCSLIRSGEATMEHPMKAIVDRYFSPDDKAEWAKTAAPAYEGMDYAAYQAQWRTLSDTIAAALPLDPAGAEAQALLDQWFALLKPFTAVATPQMWNGVAQMYSDMPKWQNEADPGFSYTVWQFIASATKARRDAGGTIDGPGWMTGAR